MGMDQYIYVIFPSREATDLNSHTSLDQRQYVQEFRKDYDMHDALVPFFIDAVSKVNGNVLTKREVDGQGYMGIRLTPEMLDAIAEHRPTPCRDVFMGSDECVTCYKDNLVAESVKAAHKAMAQDMMVYYSADW